MPVRAQLDFVMPAVPLRFWSKLPCTSASCQVCGGLWPTFESLDFRFLALALLAPYSPERTSLSASRANEDRIPSFLMTRKAAAGSPHEILSVGRSLLWNLVALAILSRLVGEADAHVAAWHKSQSVFCNSRTYS